MSKTKDKSYLRKVEGTGSLAEISDWLRNYAEGQVTDILDRLMFLQHQRSLTLRNADAVFDKGDPEAFFKAVEEALIRYDRLSMKMDDLLKQMPSPEAREQDRERILAILEEVIPGSREKIIQRMKNTPSEGKEEV
jgi:hypothetical protein